MTGENAQYLQVFLDESAENLQVLNEICLKLEQGATDDDFATMFRAAHTLKGMSATMGYANMAQLTHRLEDALGVLRAKPQLIHSDIIDAFFGAIDALESMLSEIQETGTDGQIDSLSLLKAIENALQPLSQTEGEIAAAVVHPKKSQVDFGLPDALREFLLQCKNRGNQSGYIRVELADDCIMKGPRAIMVVRAIDAFADVVHCEPGTEDIESGSFSGDICFIVVLRENDQQGLLDAVRSISEVTAVDWIPFEEFDNRTFVVPSDVASTSPSSRDDGGTNQSPTPKTTRQPENNQGRASLDRTIRVPVERLDHLMNLLSELVIDKTRLVSIASEITRTELKDIADKLSRTSTDLQSSVMSLRMVPVESLFQRFPRMIRDLSKSLNKEIRLEMAGLDTEFDRTVIDEMGEALVHLIRNAADHGLESTDSRVKAGKPPHGTIHLRAYPAGQHVFIEVQDDGGGIHTDKVRDRALSKGMITRAQADAMSPAQIHSLLFESGFSTADTVSDISGRGVGLDAVKRKVESLGGRIQIDSSIGVGSTFRIQLPLTLSILQALLVNISGDTFAIPLGNVEEVVSVRESEVKQVHGQKVLGYRDKFVPILDAGNWLYGSTSLVESNWNLVVCKSGTGRLAIGVQDLVGQQEIVNKSLGSYLRETRWFSGATILGNGQIALIVDVHSWMNSDS